MRARLLVRPDTAPPAPSAGRLPPAAEAAADTAAGHETSVMMRVSERITRVLQTIIQYAAEAVEKKVAPPLALAGLNLTKFNWKSKSGDAIAALLQALEAVPPAQRAEMRRELRSHRRLFEYGRRDGQGAEAALVRAMRSRTGAESPAAAYRGVPRARRARPGEPRGRRGRRHGRARFATSGGSRE